jgi:hypothetical protein
MGRHRFLFRELDEHEARAAAIAAETAEQREQRLLEVRRLVAAGFWCTQGWWRDGRLGGVAPSLTRAQALELVARRFQRRAASWLRGAS